MLKREMITFQLTFQLCFYNQLSECGLILLTFKYTYTKTCYFQIVSQEYHTFIA